MVVDSELHGAARAGDEQRITRALDSGRYDINAQDGSGHSHTPLHVAAYMGRNDACRTLLARGADATIKDHDGDTAAALATKRGYQETADLINGWTQPQSSQHGGQAHPSQQGNQPQPSQHGGQAQPSQQGNQPQPSQHGGQAQSSQHGGQVQHMHQSMQLLPKLHLYTRELNRGILASSLPHHWALTFTWEHTTITYEGFYDEVTGDLYQESSFGGPSNGEVWRGNTWYFYREYQINVNCTPEQVKEEAIRLAQGKYKKLTNNCQTFVEKLAERFGVELPTPSTTIIDNITSKSIGS